jgi:hypothetical protein
MKDHATKLEYIVRQVFSELGPVECVWRSARQDSGADMLYVTGKHGLAYVFAFEIRERITPQIADELFSRLEKNPPPEGVIRIFYAPVISPRVAEIARRHGISYMDCAGNCRIVEPLLRLLISRSGNRNEASAEKQAVIDPFSPKSSRIVRAMLQEPQRGWQVGELAEHPDVRVSIGLVSKVKRALVRDSYAVVHDRLLYLKQPLELLSAWAREYSGPADERHFYVRGDTREVEGRICAWCQQSNIEHALARFSAAWRLAPEVRYSVAALYVEPEALRPSGLESLRSDGGAKPIESGANLVLLAPYDPSVFVRRTPTPEARCKPIWT